MEKITNLKVGRFQIRCLSFSDTPRNILYFAGGFEEVQAVASELENMLKQKGISTDLPVLCAIDGIEWGADLSPWPAEKVFHNGEDFSGGAPDFLKVLTEEIIPKTEEVVFGDGLSGESRSGESVSAEHESVKSISAEHKAVKSISEAISLPHHRGIIGYSLGGLFSFWSLFSCDAFDCAASVSGSLWYDGFTDFAKATAFPKTPIGVYLSVGDKEHKTRNIRMASVETCMNDCEALCLERGIPVRKERNHGNHFVDVPVRIAKAVMWLAGQMN